jgi:beta-galactosidase
MTSMRTIPILCLLMTLGLGAAAAAADDLPADIVVNGGFALDADRDGCPDGWGKAQGVAMRSDAEGSWLRIERPGAGVSQRIRLDPSWYKLGLSLRMRTSGVVVGDAGWKDARLAMTFVDGAGQRVGNWPNVFHASGTTAWTVCERTYAIPKGAAFLQLAPTNYGTAGTADFAAIRIAVVQGAAQQEDLPLPAGQAAPWEAGSAASVSSPTRGRICLNGLWRFLPVIGEAAPRVPANGEGWGWFKVPGMWPGPSGTPVQTVHLSPWLEQAGADPGKMEQAWYRRDISVPVAWAGRRVAVEFTMLQTHAKVFIDGKAVGEAWFPGGPVDITAGVVPGTTQSLALLVTARPLDAESKEFMAPDRVMSSKTRLNMKGVTGDVFLLSGPNTESIADVLVLTSTRKGEIRLDVGLAAVSRAGARLRMAATVSERGAPVKSFVSEPFTAADLKDGRFSFAAPWPDAKRWDPDTPQNVYEVAVKLLAEDGSLLDESLPETFGFREFWADGRDLMLNGAPIHLRALCVSSICGQADRASLEANLAMCRRSAAYGFNFFITGNYGFTPGQTGYLDGFYEAADRTGMLVSCSLPHGNNFNWLKTPEDQARYRELATWVIRRVQNHPSVVAYAVNHNATGYYGDQNPSKIDGVYDPAMVDDPGSPIGPGFRSRRVQAELAAAIAKSCDPSRLVYHHQSGNLGDLYTINTYLNWAPLQERSDWLEHWSTVGVKPLFLVEWGLPHIASWSSYRGPSFIWRTEAFQQIWDSEFAVAYRGEEAFRMTPEKVNMTRAEERLWAAGKPFLFGILAEYLRKVEGNYLGIQALMASDNWRSHRGWGVSAMLPWDQEALWHRVAPTAPRERPARPGELQRPGIIPDLITPGRDYLYEEDQAAFAPTPLGMAFRRWNRPQLAFIGGGAADGFTGKARNFAPGETVAKQLVILNDGRRTRTCSYRVKASFATQDIAGSVAVPAGGKVLVPMSWAVPAGLADPDQRLTAAVDFGDGETQSDEFELQVVSAPPGLRLTAKVELFDPQGLTAPMLDRLGVAYTRMQGRAPAADCGILVVGREALADPSAVLDLARIATGLKVVVFEQTYETLLNRFGLRSNIHGVRNAFVRAPGHPILAGLTEANLRDWRGASTLTPPHIDTPAFETHDPRWSWCGLESTRVWRCGNRGTVASVLIEKPAKGDWLPLVDCGFDLQYAPLLQHAEGDGCIVFCQLDVSGRTEADPAAALICRNLLAYLDAFAPAPRRSVAYAGGAAGAALLDTLGVACAGAKAPGETLLVLGGGGGAGREGLLRQVEEGLNVLALGLDAAEIAALLPGVAAARASTQASAMAECLGLPEFAGTSNADLHWRTLLPFAALEGVPADRGTAALAVIARGRGRIVLCQAAPWMFDYAAKPYLRSTYRRNAFLVSRLLANLGAPATAQMAGCFARPEPRCRLPLAEGWRGEPDRTQAGREQGWWKPDFPDAGWAPIKVPGMFDLLRQDLAGYDGVFWYRHHFAIPAGMEIEDATLWIGPVDDESWVWLNGEFLGEVTKATHPNNYWSAPREYRLRPGLLRRDGDNVLVIRANDVYLNGGLASTPELRTHAPWFDGPCVQESVVDDNPYRYYRW